MELSQSKRAIDARLWRVNRREKRRLSGFVNDYVRIKHQKIYGECNLFYQSLCEKYPGKYDLTKSKEYKRWKGQVINEGFDQNFPTTESTSAVAELIRVTGEPAAVITGPTESIGEPTAVPTEPDEPTAATAEPDENITETLIVATTAEQDILQMVVEDLIPPSPEIINDIDNIINDIVRELEQDNEIRNMLDDNYLQPQHTDEDEGIGLNIDSELEAILEPFDYQLEVEGGFDY